MILLDTSVLVYAVGAEHPLREPCRALVAAIGDGLVAATTTVEVVQEFAHVRARRRGRDDAAALAERFADLLSPLVAVDRDDLGAFDAVLAAVVRHRGHLTAVVSANRAFRGIPGLVHLDPADPGFRERIGIGR